MTMEYVNLDGDRVPKLGFGTWRLRGRECFEAVLDALELGYRHLDTAQMYDNEEEVGRAIERSGVERGELFLTTKVWWDCLEHDELLAGVQRSLDRLRTDAVDLLLIHWPNPRVPLDETLSAMRELQGKGKARHLGVSNFTPSLLAEAAARAPIRCIQVEYHPFLGQRDLLAAARARSMMLTAYAPLAQGRVTDDPVLTRIGKAHGRSAAQVALRWLVQQQRVAAIPKAARAEHRRSNLEAMDFRLTEDETHQIDGLDRGRRLVDPPFAPDWED